MAGIDARMGPVDVNRRFSQRQGLLITISTLMLIFLAMPLLGLIWRGFANPEGIRALGSARVYQAVGLSVITTAISAAAILIGGTPLAWLLAGARFRGKGLLTLLIELPLVLPPVVAGLGLLLAFGRRGLIGPALEVFGVSLPFSTAAVVMAQVFVAAPLYIRAAQSHFEALPQELREAASIDGADGLAYLRHIALPISLPGLLAGLSVAWARALGEFGATILFAGSLQGRTQTMPLLVYSALESNLNEAIWTGLLLLVLAIAALGLSRLLDPSADQG